LGPKIVIIKMGGQGSLLAFKDKKHYVSVVPNTEVYDPTGAGDSFAGGVIGYIAKYGLDNPIEAVVHGSAVASYTVSGFGLEQLLKLNQKKVKSSQKVKTGDKLNIYNLNFEEKIEQLKKKYNPSNEIIKENEDLIIENNNLSSNVEVSNFPVLR